MEEVQSILMSLPSSVVVAGLDGEPVPRYTPVTEACSEATAKREINRLFRQARIRGAKTVIGDAVIQITFRSPETDNERYGYLKWHLSQVTGRTVVYKTPHRRRKKSSPRALLKSIIPGQCSIAELAPASSGNMITAIVTGLMPSEIEEIENDFQDESGMKLDLKGQMSLF